MGTMSFLARFRQNPIDRAESEIEAPFGWTRTLARVAMGIFGFALIAQAPAIPAVAGILGISGAALTWFLRQKAARPKLSSTEPLSKIERALAASGRLDETTLWIRSATYGAILSIVPTLFWPTAMAYLKLFGWLASLPWFAAAVFTAIPAILFLWEAIALAREGRILRKELEDGVPPDSLGPAFSI